MPDAEMHNVLLLINNDIAAVKEFERLAGLMLTSGNMRPVMFIDENMYYGMHVDVPAFCKERGIEVLTSADLEGGDGFSALGKQGTAVGRWIARAAFELIPRLKFLPRRWFSAGDLSIVGAIRDAMLRRAAACEAVLSQRRYTALIIAEDNVELDTAVWIAIARRHGVRTIILPYTMSNTAEFLESYVGHAPYQVGAESLNRVAARLFPRWAARYKGKHFLRTTAQRIFAAELLGLTPPNPWLMNSGYADAIAVESVAMQEYCLAGGHPARQLVITGSQTDDVIAETLSDVQQRRREYLTSAGLPPEQPVLLCALPPDQNTFNRPGSEFADFDDLLCFWSECLTEVKGWNVIVRPHPKTSPERLEPLRASGLSVTFDATATLVPICDLYVASISSTIRWAIACGKPVINYDVYQYDYGDYDGVKGVAQVNTRSAFRELVRGLTTDGNRLAAMTAAQQAVAERWGYRDGLSGQRILALVRGEKVSQPRAIARSDRTESPLGGAFAVGGG